ncbi:MAG: FMN-binding protein [Candidatus Sericytochromatia bacterium]
MKLVRNTVFLLGLSLFINLPINNVSADENPEYYEQVYMTEKQALDTVLPDLEVEKKEFILTPEKKKIIQKRLKRKIKDKSFNFFIGKKDGKEEKYAIILDEQGKHFPMTFIVSLDNKATVDQVAVMVYREKRGDAVKRKRFLNQFKNKSSKDSIEVDTDIIHLTGATISSWSVASGVKKAVVLTEELILSK